MKAVQVDQYGGSEVAKVKEVSVLSPLPDQVLVQVYAAALNPFDYKIRSGMYKNFIPLDLPYIPGGDFAGVVKDLGENVSEFKVGDAIFGSALVLSGGTGSFAEFACASVKNSALNPKSIDFIQAASLPLVGSSAIQALEEHINLKKGQKILIHGGAGGIGNIAIQLAKYLGAYVATTVAVSDVSFAKSLGADQVIDYQKERFEEKLAGFDAVFDTVGGEVTERSFKVLKRGGTLVSMLGAPSEELAKQHQVTAIGQNTMTNKENLVKLAELADEGAIKPQVNKVFPLTQVKEAFDYLEKGSPRGKVVLKIKD